MAAPIATVAAAVIVIGLFFITDYHLCLLRRTRLR